MKPLQLLCIFCLANVFACATLPSSERVKTTESTHTYVLRGEGSTTVILEAGLGNGKESWSSVYDEISKLARVFAYDRAGYGSSKSSNTEGDGDTVNRELRLTLQALAVDPPFILVGHSLGGTYMELFARRFPDDIAGVVLVDSRHADFTRQCELAGAEDCTPPARAFAKMGPGPRREFNGLNETMRLVSTASAFPDVPLFVVSGGRHTKSSAEFGKVWLETQESLSRLSDQSEFTVCEKCSHFVHWDNPEIVVSAVRAVLYQASDK